jgi:UPF0716 family protein affecting phage T7 exclusion
MTALLLLLAIPVLEIVVFFLLAGAVGGWWALAGVLATSALGGWIVRREGRRAWRGLGEALRRGTVPERELPGAGMLLAGGLLLLAPGFLTDVAGLLFVLPFTRPVMRRVLASYGERRLRAAESRGAVFPPGLGGDGFGGYGVPFGGSGGGAPERPSGRVVQGEIVEEEDPSGARSADASGKAPEPRRPE